MTKIWVGLDVGEAKTAVCVTDELGGTLLETVVDSSSSQISASILHFGRAADATIVLEAGMANQLARNLRRADFAVVVLDTVRARKFLEIRRNKTDTNDARGLAEMGRLRNVPGRQVHVKSASCQHLRSKLVVRDTMVRQRTAIDLSLRTLLREHGGDRHAAPPKKGWRDNLPLAIAEIRDREGVDLAQQALPLASVREALNSYICWADKDLRDAAKSNQVTKQFMKIPGVGPICALSFYSALDDPWRFKQVTDAGAYLGIVPSVKQSGTILQRSRITKAGNKLTRCHLVMAASVMISRAAKRSELGDWGRALAARIGYTKAKVAVARKLSVIMLSIWKSGQEYECYPRTPPTLENMSLDPDHMSGVMTPHQELGPSLSYLEI